MKTSRCCLIGGVATIALVSGLPVTARAAEVIVVVPRHDSNEYDSREDEASSRAIEIEPHFSFGAENVYGADGYGGGVRISIPLVRGHIGRIPENLAISFGGDFLHYDNCYYAGYCGANYLLFPVAAQWNVFVHRRVSLFLEGGVFIYKGWYSPCEDGNRPDCSQPSDFGLLPTLAIGGRIHVARNAAVTLRLGYPTTTLGVSFM